MPLILEKLPDLRLVVVGHGQLREPMEVFINALATGNRDLVQEIVARGRWLEGAIDGEDSKDDLNELTGFFDELVRRGDSDRYFEAARRLFKQSTVIFTGYLTHRELRFLFPCCDVGVFPSIVREAGPWGFVGALASGCFPLGTYFGGLAASIDAVTPDLPGEVADTMKLSRDNTTFDIADRVPRAVDIAPLYGKQLAQIARDRYDWTNVAKTFRTELLL
jgi:glycosyltransferase involved in cell wall biosynthesis